MSEFDSGRQQKQCDLCAENFSTSEKYCSECMEEHSHCEGCEELVDKFYLDATATGLSICYNCASILMKAWRTDF